MDTSAFPTKRNLLQAKHNLKLAQQGHELLDRKRQVLLAEYSAINNSASTIRENFNKILADAKHALVMAQMAMGSEAIKKISHTVEKITVDVQVRTVMGVVIPQVEAKVNEKITAIHKTPPYSLDETVSPLDDAVIVWQEAINLILKLAETENAANRLKEEMRQAQKRAAALSNITMPALEALIKRIQEQLEERERDELARLKLAKSLLNQ